jgi:hypothetical protein
MSRGRHSFKQGDLTRAIKAVEADGLLKPYHVRIDDGGKPVVIVGVDLDKPQTDAVGSWDDVVAELERQ